MTPDFLEIATRIAILAATTTASIYFVYKKFHDIQGYRTKKTLENLTRHIWVLNKLPSGDRKNSSFQNPEESAKTIFNDCLFTMHFGISATGTHKETILKLHKQGVTRKGLKLANSLIDPTTGHLKKNILFNKISRIGAALAVFLSGSATLISLWYALAAWDAGESLGRHALTLALFFLVYFINAYILITEHYKIKLHDKFAAIKPEPKPAQPIPTSQTEDSQTDG